MKMFATGMALFAMVTVTSLAHSKPPASDHPILGSWQLSENSSVCVETERFESNGHNYVTSGQEVSVSDFEISPQPSEKGFYRVVDTILEDNGKPDCVGNVTPVGDVAVIYIRFEDQGNAYLLCMEENVRSCFAIARRTSG